jgi:hypothetical protein
VGDDHKRIPKVKGRYVFGHFELPGYLMNAMVAMPDHGEIRRDDFNHIENVFTGHFHKRQTQENITYIGNCFPHNYADAGDDARGLTILEWGKAPEYHTWPDQPTYRVFALSDILNVADQVLKPNMHVRVNLDVEISYEEANFIKETFVNTYNLREITLLPQKNTDPGVSEYNTEIKFESVDQIVTSQLANIESEHYDRNILMEIYRHL